MQIPEQWPPQVAAEFEPIRVLGKGGFASVVLARKRSTSDGDGDGGSTSEKGEKNTQPEQLAALKVVGSKNATRTELGYAYREMDILAELSHPNIMRLLEVWEGRQQEHQPSKVADGETQPISTCAAVMALSYAKGPTVEDLLRHGGRLGFVFVRVISAQLIDAVAYLHSRAVIHRDIKPDNLIVTGASLQDNAIWDEDDNGLDSVVTDWKALTKKWHLTLVDFGFARALTPADMKKKLPRSNSTGNSSGELDSSTSTLNRSMSFRFKRKMSALGNRAFAAPEIVKGVTLDNNPSSHSVIDVTNTLSDHVSYYGMMVDAYSIGNTMKYCLTGAPPDQDVNEVIDLENNPIIVLARCLCRCSSKTNRDSNKERKVQYRRVHMIPTETRQLIQGLTQYDAQQRTSVRTARRYPYVDDVLEGEAPPLLKQEIHYLSIALKHGENEMGRQPNSSSSPPLPLP